MASTLDILSYQDAVWIDLNADYNLNTRPEILLDNQAINGSLRNLLRCRVGSRRMLREYGTYLFAFLQEPLTPITADSIFTSLVQSIERWEPRVKIDLVNSLIEPDTRMPGYRITLLYTILKTNIVSQLQFSVKKL